MTIKQEYAKEIINLKRRLARLEAKGIDITGFNIPKTPKKPTKASVEKIHKLRGTALRSKIPSIKAQKDKEEKVKHISNKGLKSTDSKRSGKVTTTTPQFDVNIENVSRETQPFPDTSIIGRVIDDINELPDYKIVYKDRKTVYIDISSAKYNALMLIEDRRGQEGDIELARDLSEKQDRIFQDTFIIHFDSDEDMIRSSIVSLLVALKGSSLTREEAKDADLWASSIAGYNEG